MNALLVKGVSGKGNLISSVCPYLTGTLRPVRRSFYDPTSAPGQGWLWEWENDAGSWTPYDMEVSIALQAARDRQQPWLDLAPLGFCYLVDFQSMTQINQQTQRRRRIQRRSDMAYPLVSGPLPKASQGWGTGPGGAAGSGGTAGGGSNGALLGVGVSGSSSSGNGVPLYTSGTLSTSSLSSPGQPCACQQCMLVLSVKANAMASQTLGRRLPPTKVLGPKSGQGTIPYSSTVASISNSYSQTLPHGLSLNRSLSQERKNAAAFAQSLSMLTSNTATLSLSSNRPPPPSLPPPPPPPVSHQQSFSMPSCTTSTSSPSVPTATLITVATSSTSCSSSSSASTAVPPQRSAACAAPLPPRASLAGLSRPALQRIAMAQSRALIASG